MSENLIVDRILFVFCMCLTGNNMVYNGLIQKFPFFFIKGYIYPSMKKRGNFLN